MPRYTELPWPAFQNGLTAAVLFIFAGILMGCPYTSSVPMGTEKLPVDEELLGRWIPVYGEMAEAMKSGKAPGDLYVEFDQRGPTTLNRIYGALETDLTQLPEVGPSMLTEPGFVTDVGRVHILNVRVLLRIDGEDKKVYRFYRYAVNDQFLQMWPVAEDLFQADGTLAEFDDPSQLHAYARGRVNREGFFYEEFELFVRADASVTATDMFLRGERAYEDENYTEALPWFTAAADRGSSLAQRRIGDIYISADKGVSPDTAKAVMYYERAARQGDKWAQNDLADLLYDGYWTDENGVKSFHRDPRQAVDWWMKASEKGWYSADLELVKAFVQGKGIQRDLHRARRHAVRWASLSDPDRKYGRQWLAKLIDYEIQRQAQGVSLSEIECSDINTRQVVDGSPRLVGELRELWKQVRYPDVARQAGVEAIVSTNLHIGPTGKVMKARAIGIRYAPLKHDRDVEAEVLEAIRDQMEREAIRVAQMAHFTPPTQYGLPVCVILSIPIKFDLSTAARKAAPAQDVSAASTVLEAIQSIKATSRPSLVDQSTKVLILRNPSRESVRFRLVCVSPQGRRKSFTVSLDPYGSTELGFMQGWEGNFTSGDVCTAFDGETSVWRVTF
jgi:TPR repeat protein